MLFPALEKIDWKVVKIINEYAINYRKNYEFQ